MKKILHIIIFSLLAFASSDILAQSQTDLDKGLRFIEQNAEKWGLVESDYSDVLISDMYTNNNTGITYIYLNQAYQGVPIQNAITPIVISPDGKVSMVNHRFIKGIKERINTVSPIVTPTAAIKSSASHLGIGVKSIPTLLRSNPEKNTYEFGKADFSENEITVKMIYVNIDGQLKLAWNLAIDEIHNVDYYNTSVDAISGEVISKYNYTTSCKFHDNNNGKHTTCNHEKASKSPMATLAEANTALSTAAGSYTVFGLPAESPIHGDYVTLVDPEFLDASPFGWHDTNGTEGAEFTITRGNNVHAFVDLDAMGTSSNDEPQGGDNLVFDEPFDPALEIALNTPAATVNLFYMNNMMHDITHRLGFDEQSGNFQQNNYGNGGAGGDFVSARASAGFEAVPQQLNNANFSTPPDGNNGSMNMFLWNNPSGVVSIDQPAELAGFLNPVGTGDFGQAIPTEDQEPLQGKVVIAFEGGAGNPTTACNALENTAELEGNIALVDRGLCEFGLKALNAQQAGAISVLICNVPGAGGDGEEVINMTGGQFGADVSIIPLFLRTSDCDRIRASINAGVDVSISIQNSPPMGPDFLDGSLDNGIIAHEYGHGISIRLVGGPSAAGCLTTDEQAGEGISDYFSLITTVEEGDAGTDARGIGNYAGGDPANGRGIRRFPYSTDMNVNPQVYDDIITSTLPHSLGEIWAITLWEVYWGFVDEFGLDISWEDTESGNFKAARLAIEGMKLVPCNPSFIDLRDGVMQADSMLYNGDNAEILWTAFAKRGLGYLATDGGNSNDQTDGSQSFEPFPLAIASLKVQAVTTEVVQSGEEITVSVSAQNHIGGDPQTGVIITSVIPEGLEYVEGSASMSATFDNGVLSIDVGEMAFLDEISMTYQAIASGSISSETLFFDNVDDTDGDGYDFGATEGFSLWTTSDGIANSGDVAWWAQQEDVVIEVDFWLNAPPLQVVGIAPALRIFHRYETEAGADAGFLEISTDGGQTFTSVQDKWIRNGYPTDIQFGTFAIPSLEAFSGTTDSEFIDSYLDLSDYIGEEIIVRFRFGTDDNTGPESEERGWYVDDIEMMDLVSYETFTCITSETTTEEQCTAPLTLIIDSDGTVSTKNEELDGFNINIAPNPASDYITVSLTAENSTPVVISLTSMDGRVISNQAAVARNTNSVRTFDVSDLTAGMYLIQIKSETGLTTKKVVIQ